MDPTPSEPFCPDLIRTWFTLIRTWFGEISGLNQVEIRSKSGPNQVWAEGFGGFWRQRGSSGWEGPCSASPNPEIPKRHRVYTLYTNFSRSSRELLPFSLWHKWQVRNPTEIVQKNLFRWTFLFWAHFCGFFRVDFPPVKSRVHKGVCRGRAGARKTTMTATNVGVTQAADSCRQSLICASFFGREVFEWDILNSRRSGPEKGVITKGIFSLEESLESLKSLNSLESLENGRILLCFPESGDSLKSLESLNSLESLENGLFWKDPFQKTPFSKPEKKVCRVGGAIKTWQPETWQNGIFNFLRLPTFYSFGRHFLTKEHPPLYNPPTAAFSVSLGR